MDIDLSILSKKGVKWAVHCPDKESAELFVEAMRRQYPTHTKSWAHNARWESYRENTVYCPDVNGEHGDNRMTYSDLGFFMNPLNGFTVVAFDSLCIPFEDLPEFEAADIESLLAIIDIEA